MSATVYKGKKNGEQLAAIGYRVVSRRHMIVSRIDREDWAESMAATHVRGMEWVRSIGEGSAQDYYRRCLSKDCLIVKSIEGIPNSGHQITAYDRRKA